MLPQISNTYEEQHITLHKYSETKMSEDVKYLNNRFGNLHNGFLILGPLRIGSKLTQAWFYKNNMIDFLRKQLNPQQQSDVFDNAIWILFEGGYGNHYQMTCHKLYQTRHVKNLEILYILEIIGMN